MPIPVELGQQLGDSLNDCLLLDPEQDKFEIFHSFNYFQLLVLILNRATFERNHKLSLVLLPGFSHIYLNYMQLTLDCLIRYGRQCLQREQETGNLGNGDLSRDRTVKDISHETSKRLNKPFGSHGRSQAEEPQLIVRKSKGLKYQT